MSSNDDNLTFGGHLEVLRKMLFRIIGVVTIFAVVIFSFKEYIWRLLLAPSECDFITYRMIEEFFGLLGVDYKFEKFYIDLVATDLSSQFMTHITTSIYLALLIASPYILYELFRFVTPALYEEENKYSKVAIIITYGLFVFGVLISYFILFPVSFRFLGTYSVSPRVHSTITLDSYISTFTTLTLVMGVVFQMPVVAYVLNKFGLIDSSMMLRYRKHAFILIMLLAAFITPPDIKSLILVAIPLYMLYEISIRVIAQRY